VQAVLMNITDRQGEYARQVQKFLRKQGLRVETDLRNEKIGFKIREQTLRRVPYLLIVGDREVEAQTVAVRTRGGEDLGDMSWDVLTQRFAGEIARRGRSSLED
jgi:threonyl-tRNA synthetase